MIRNDLTKQIWSNHMNINELKGIGEKTEKVFNKAGIHTTDDLNTIQGIMIYMKCRCGYVILNVIKYVRLKQ